MVKTLKTFILIMLIGTTSLYADTESAINEYSAILQSVKNNCDGISEKLNQIKNMAVANTIVTGAGTIAGGVALYAGVSKNKIDKQAEELEQQLNNIENMSNKDFLRFLKDAAAYEEALETYQNICNQKKSLEKESKKLGNIRTGAMAGNTATAIAGTIIANKNKNDARPIVAHVSDCLKSLEKLPNTIGQARIDGNTYYSTKLQNINDTCGKFYTKNLEKISNHSKVAMISSAINIGTGTVGTITSAVANTDATRNNNTEGGKKKEKNLNNASNVLAGVSTATSGLSTVFNAMTIKAINDNLKTAKECEEALR